MKNDLPSVTDVAGRPASVRLEPSAVEGCVGLRAIVVLRGPGCKYDRDGPGCSFCNFRRFWLRDRVPTTEEYLGQFGVARARLGLDSCSAPLELDIFNSGSFLNPEEVPLDAQRALVLEAIRIPAVKVLLIESRPEYVSIESLEPLVDLLSLSPGTKLEVALGLESVDPATLSTVHKGFGTRQFEKAVEVIALVRAHLMIYLMLKPRPMPTRVAQDEVVRSASHGVRMAKAAGIERVRLALHPTHVLPGTELANDFFEGRYKPPSLHEVMRVTRRIAEIAPVRIGLWDEGLEPIARVDSCPVCREAVLEAMRRFNVCGNVEVLEPIRCDCDKGGW